eukprot:5196755-Prymnesium_polylepis.2
MAGAAWKKHVSLYTVEIRPPQGRQTCHVRFFRPSATDAVPPRSTTRSGGHGLPGHSSPGRKSSQYSAALGALGRVSG